MTLLVSSFTKEEIGVLHDSLPLFEIIAANTGRIVATACGKSGKEEFVSNEHSKFKALDAKLAAGKDEPLSQEEADLLCNSLLCTTFDISGRIRTINDIFSGYSTLKAQDCQSASALIAEFDAVQSLLAKIVPHASEQCKNDMSEYDLKKWGELPLEFRGLADF